MSKGRRFPPLLSSPREVPDPLAVNYPLTPRYSFDAVILLLFQIVHYLFYIPFIKEKKLLKQHGVLTNDFHLCQLNINIPDFIFLLHLEQLVLLSLWGRYFFHLDPGY